MRGKKSHQLERRLRREKTDAEARMWRCLRDRRLAGLKFRRQHRIGIYIVDFVCVEMRLVVELDGGQHLERAGDDERRAGFLHDRGYRVLRYWNDDVLVQTDAVLEVIWAAVRDGDAAT